MGPRAGLRCAWLVLVLVLVGAGGRECCHRSTVACAWFAALQRKKQGNGKGQRGMQDARQGTYFVGSSVETGCWRETR